MDAAKLDKVIQVGVDAAERAVREAFGGTDVVVMVVVVPFERSFLADLGPAGEAELRRAVKDGVDRVDIPSFTEP